MQRYCKSVLFILTDLLIYQPILRINAIAFIHVCLFTFGNQSFTKFVGVFQVRLKMLVTILPFVFFREQVEVIFNILNL